MKVVICLFAVLAVAAARPQELGPQFWPETLGIAQQKQFVRPYERILEIKPAPLVNEIENVPYNQPVSVQQIVFGIDQPAVYPTLQRSVDESLARF